MTVIHIQVPDNLEAAFEKAFPEETIESFVARMLQSAVAERKAKLPKASLVESFRRLQAEFPPASNDELRRWRHEGRP